MTALPSGYRMTIEFLNPDSSRRVFRAVLFDFDGTLSLIREGWADVMVGMMTERLRGMGLMRASEPDERAGLERLVMALNGAPTIRQMEAFAEEVRRRGGRPDDPWDYLRDYLDRLTAVVRDRWAALESGAASADAWVVPGAHGLLAELRDRGVPLFVASGTDLDHVEREAGLLGLAGFFPTGINAPKDNDPAFSKAAVIDRILRELRIGGEELLGFGDGVVETTEVKKVGGVAVGVASSPHGSRPGIVNPDKQARLLAAGADLIIPDYSDPVALVRRLWGD